LPKSAGKGEEMQDKQAINWSSTIHEASELLRAGTGTSTTVDNKKIRVVAISSIFPDPSQPRKNIDPTSQDIQDLAQSIKQHGFINFIMVRQKDEGYVIVSGERRFTAAKLIGLEKIPVFVISGEKEATEYCLLQLEENIQRKDLAPLDEAEAYERLQKEFSLKQVDIAEMIKKSKGYVSQMLRIAQIHTAIKDDIRKTCNPVSKEVLWLLSAYPEEEQARIWEQIKSNPTESNLRKATRKNKEKDDPTEKKIEPNRVFDALQQVLRFKGAEAIFDYIPMEKRKKLLKEVEKIQSQPSATEVAGL
jgi:ParB family chromosome partitioning protein